MDLDGVDEVLWYNAALDGYAAQTFVDTAPDTTVWLGNIGTENWTVSHVDEFVL